MASTPPDRKGTTFICYASKDAEFAGKNVGNIDIMPLRPDAVERFRAGTLPERNLRGRDFHRIDERKEISALYFGSVATTIDRHTAPREPEPHAADTALQMLPVLVDRVCDRQPTTMI